MTGGRRAGGQIERRRYRETDESDFIGRCPTNVERPIKLNKVVQLIFHKCNLNIQNEYIKIH